jgi:outer membrane beta-barrel protein
MESRILVFLLRGLAVLGIVALTGCGRGGMTVDASADAEVPVINPQVERRDIRPADIDTEDFELGAYVGFMSVEDFGSNAVYGATLAYHVSEHWFVQGTYGQTDTEETSFEILSGGAQLLSDDQRTLKYYDLSLGFNLLPGEAFIGRNWALNSSLYATAGVGNTGFAGDDFFTVSFGAGYRMLPIDWLALHFDVRDRMFDTDLLGDEKTTHNIEFTLGMTFFF